MSSPSLTNDLSDDPYKPARNSIIGAAVLTIKEGEEAHLHPKAEEPISFRDAEIETVEKVLQTIDRASEKRKHEGFDEISFTIGVLNCFFVVVVFAVYPQHFWLVYVTECLYLIPRTLLYNLRAKPLNQVLYYLDYCWVMNLLVNGFLIFTLSAFCTFSFEMRQQIFLAAVGTCTGTLTGACLVLPFVAIVFHDPRTMTNVLIHLMPTMMMYTGLWHQPTIHEAWPNVFPYVYDHDTISFFPNDKAGLFFPGTGVGPHAVGSVAGNAVALYSLWWVLYVIWMVFLGGIDLPRKDKDKPPVYDTVFHSTVRHGLAVVIGKVCWGRPASVSEKQQEMDHYELRDFFVYMTFHAIGAYFGGTMILANAAWHSQQAHLAIIMLLTFVAVYRGAERYTYYATDMYGRSVRKEFRDILPEKEGKKKKTK